MNRVIITTLVMIFILAAPLAWAEGDSNGRRSPQQPEEQSVTGAASQPAEQAAPKGRTRGIAISDFVADERSVEKDDGEGNNGRAPAQPLVQQRAPEKKCSGDSC